MNRVKKDENEPVLYHDEVHAMKNDPLSSRAQLARQKLRIIVLNDDAMWKELQAEMRRLDLRTNFFVEEVLNKYMLERVGIAAVHKSNKICDRPPDKNALKLLSRAKNRSSSSLRSVGRKPFLAANDADGSRKMAKGANKTGEGSANPNWGYHYDYKTLLAQGSKNVKQSLSSRLVQDPVAQTYGGEEATKTRIAPRTSRGGLKSVRSVLERALATVSPGQMEQECGDRVAAQTSSNASPDPSASSKRSAVPTKQHDVTVRIKQTSKLEENSGKRTEGSRSASSGGAVVEYTLRSQKDG